MAHGRFRTRDYALMAIASGVFALASLYWVASFALALEWWAR